MPNAVKTGRELIERGRGAGDDVVDSLTDVRDSLDDLLAQADGLLARFDRRRPSLKLPLIAIAIAGIVGGYLIGRRRAEPEPPPSNGKPDAAAEPSMEVATAVEVSRPQPAELDEIVPPSNGDGESDEPAASKSGNGAKSSQSKS